MKTLKMPQIRILAAACPNVPGSTIAIDTGKFKHTLNKVA
jgi:hypothetical protein